MRRVGTVTFQRFCLGIVLNPVHVMLYIVKYFKDNGFGVTVGYIRQTDFKNKVEF